MAIFQKGQQASGQGMLIISADYIPNKNYEFLGLVSGNVAYSKHIGRDMMAGIKNIAGGEIKSYTDLLAEARTIAEGRMQDQAAAMGADAIIGVRLANDTVAQGTIEVVAYGTAIKWL